jgi:hypothetical protein
VRAASRWRAHRDVPRETMSGRPTRELGAVAHEGRRWSARSSGNEVRSGRRLARTQGGGAESGGACGPARAGCVRSAGVRAARHLAGDRGDGERRRCRAHRRVAHDPFARGRRTVAGAPDPAAAEPDRINPLRALRWRGYRARWWLDQLQELVRLQRAADAGRQREDRDPRSPRRRRRTAVACAPTRDHDLGPACRARGSRSGANLWEHSAIGRSGRGSSDESWRGCLPGQRRAPRRNGADQAEIARAASQGITLPEWPDPPTC